MAPEAVEIAWAGAAGVGKGDGPALFRDLRGIDAEGRPAPIDMGVQVDKAGDDELARDIGCLGPGARQIAADFRDLAVLESDVGDLIAPVSRIDDAPAGDNQMVHEGSEPSGASLHEPKTRRSRKTNRFNAVAAPRLTADVSR
jgi:hypothetical protein